MEPPAAERTIVVMTDAEAIARTVRSRLPRAPARGCVRAGGARPGFFCSPRSPRPPPW